MKYVKNIPLNVEANYITKQAPIHNDISEYQKYIQYNYYDDSDYENDYYYRNDDRYPLTILETIRSSNTATAVYDTKGKFIAGSGASDAEMGEFIVNPKTGMTVNDLINVLSKDIAKQKQVYIWVKLNELKSDIFSLDRISPQNARLGKPNNQNEVARVLYSPSAFGSYDQKGTNKGKTKGHPFYSEEKIAANQIYYENFDREYNEYYPYPFDKSQVQLFRTDAQITSFHYNNLKNNFFGGAIVSIVGDPTKEVQVDTDKETGAPIMRQWGDVLAEEIGKTKAGADNAGNMTLLWTQPDSIANTQTPQIQPITANTQADIFSKTQEDITDNIARFAKVPTILANIQVSGKLGNTEELLNSTDLLNNDTRADRKHLERILNKFLPRFVGWNFSEPLTIQPLTLVRNIPDRVWQSLTEQEKRNWIEENFNIELEELPEQPEVPINPQEQRQAEQEVQAVIDGFKQLGDKLSKKY